MKKLLSIMAILLILFTITFATPIYAASLDSIDITTNKQTVHPGETVKVNVAFGTELGSYTVDIAYDKNLFDYVSSEGGTENDNGTRVRVYYFDQTGGSSPRNSMSVTFKAKADIITSNPTDFSITAEGLANADASVTYDDISVPIVKNVVVEPNYVNYAINLSYTGEVIKNEGKDMKITISSTMGKNYEHTRLIAEVVAPTGGDVQLIGKDSQGLDHDIIQSGWGSASGDPIGGKNVVKELDVKGLFNTAGEYAITLKLIDRDNSDATIASKTFQVTVKEKATTTTPETNTENKNETVTAPSTLPKTGGTIYVVIISAMAALVTAYTIISKNNKK